MSPAAVVTMAVLSVFWPVVEPVAIAAPARQIAQVPLQTPEETPESKIPRLLETGAAQAANEEDAAAAESYRQALGLIEGEEPINLTLKGKALYGLGQAYLYLQDDDAALPVLTAAAELYEELVNEGLAGPDDADIRIELLVKLGEIHHKRADFATALRFYQSGFGLAQASHQLTPEKQAILQHNMGSIAAELGQYDEAQAMLQTAADLSEQIENVGLQASAIFTLGWVSERQKDEERAIAYYQSAIALYTTILKRDADSANLQDISNRQVRALNNFGMLQMRQGNLAMAQATFERGFDLLARRESDRERSILVNSLGSLYQASGEVEQAWHSYRQALRLTRQTNNKFGEIETLLNMGRLMEAQQQPNLAIFFYKQAIAQIETIRQDLQQLSQSVQQRYTLTVEDFYRNLADLLLQQNREAEALQILELLKLQEIRSYLHSDQAEGRQETLNTPLEADLLTVFNASSTDISLADFLELAEAIALRNRANHPIYPSADASDPKSPANTAFNLQAIESLKLALAQQPIKTAALYPLILEDRLEILLLTPEGTVERFKTQVSQAELSRTVEDFQKSLKSKVLDAKPAAQQLYKWLIQPIEETLAARGVKNIVYLPDGVLRYVPLAAFHDGQHWLVETYQSHNITAASVGDLTKQNQLPLSVIAGAFTDTSLAYEVQVGASTVEYRGLSAAQQEIDRLETALPNTLALLNGDFTPERTLGSISNHRIVHLATHANFVPGQPEDSFILFGDGKTVNMREIREWSLPTVDLVVLSACETASSTQGEGKEILGLGFQIQQTGAGAAIASLWSVDDSSTAALMSQFYLGLSEGKTKAQALRQAQIDLIRSDGFSNPNDWSAFILIGNGL
ncbi:MAG: CHAT domain-containing protein [Phormidesmis sp.]